MKNKNSELYAAREEGREEGWEEGREEGMKKGKIIGQILLLQQMLKLPVSAEKDLKLNSPDDLHAMLDDLKAKFSE